LLNFCFSLSLIVISFLLTRKSPLIVKLILVISLISIHVPHIYYEIYNVQLPWNTPRPYYEKALSYILLGNIIIVLTTFFFLRIPSREQNTIIRYNNKSIWIKSYYILILIRILFYISSPKQGYDIDQEEFNSFGLLTNILFVFQAVSGYLFYSCIIYLLKCSNLRLFSVIVLAEFIYWAVFTGSKSAAFIQVFLALMLLINFFPFYRRKISVLAIIFSISFLPFYLLQSIRRSFAILGKDVEYNDIVDGFKSVELSKIIENIMVRMEYTTTMAKVLEYTDSGINRFSLLDNFISTYIPRFIYANKGWSSSFGLFISEEILGLKNTHAAMTPYIEGYLYFGFSGLILFVLIYSAIVYVFHRLFYTSDNILRMSFYYGSLMLVVNTSSVLGLPKAIFLYFVILLLYYKFLRFFYKEKLNI
jgi:hypothetical protein